MADDSGGGLSGILSGLMTNPMFQAGIGMMLNSHAPIGENMAQGIQNATALQQLPLETQMKQLALQRAQKAANFNPADYLQTDSSGTQPGQTPAQQPGVGPATQQAMQTAGIPANQAPPSTPISTGSGGGMPNFNGLLQGAIQAGMSPQDAMSMAQMTNPGYFAQMQARLKGLEPYTLAPGAIRVNPMQQDQSGQQQPQAGGSGTPAGVTQNNNPPPDSKAAQVQQLMRLRDQFQPGTPQYQQYDAALNTVSGAFQQNIDTAKNFGDPVANESLAQSIANYTQPPLAGRALTSSPAGQWVMNRVKQIAPDYNAQNYETSQKAYGEFMSGTNGNTVRSMSVSIDHMNTLGQLAQALNNGNTQVINRAANETAQQLGVAAPTNFDAAKQIVAAEVGKAIVGGVVPEGDRKGLQDSLNSANSPAQLSGAINTFQSLMTGQLRGFQRQYQQSTRRNDFNNLLSPAAQNMLAQPQGAGGAGASGGPAAAPGAVNAQAQARALLRQRGVPGY
ncbi:MAG: hypothetical protein WCA85_12845 [Paraburkholderia sp.]|uniref:hypothetical protein n=1 Tax=Paraburkholderia sp. TaxID=1926495 RepID=UPI003C5913F9